MMKASARLVLVVLCLLPATLHAQKYARPPGDTIRYRETSKVTSNSETPNGPATVVMESAALLAIAFLPGDTARMWYDSINTKVDSPMGDIGGEVARQMLKKPFTIHFSPNGTVETVASPSLDGPTGPVTLPMSSAQEWFPKLPATMTIGTAWQDTVSFDNALMPGMTMKSTSIRRFRIARDSTVSGTRVLVIEVASEQETKGGGEMAGMTINSTIKGNFTGAILFAPNPGIIVGRTMSGTSEGTTNMSGAMSMSMTQRSQMESRAELVRK